MDWPTEEQVAQTLRNSYGPTIFKGLPPEPEDYKAARAVLELFINGKSQELKEALIAADSIMSLIRYRRTNMLSEQDIQDLDRAIAKCRALTE